MGFYDCRCMISGISISGVDAATLVLLGQADGSYRPIAAGIAGDYSGYCAIECGTKDSHAIMVYAYFMDRLRDGRFVIRYSHIITDGTPPTDIDNLIWHIERNFLGFLEFAGLPHVRIATLDGGLVVFALIAQPGWDAVTGGATVGQETVEALFSRLFGDASRAHELYQGRLAEVSHHVAQLSAVDDFVRGRGLTWAPPAEPAQRYPTDMGALYASEEMRMFLGEARRDLGDVAALLPVLDAHEASIIEMEDEERRT